MPEQTDRELWRRGAAGDADAFGELFERHARAIYTFCFRRTADWQVAEDLTSVVFLEAWRHRGTPLDRVDALPFLYGVAVNVLRNHRRALRRHAAALARMPAEQPVGDHADDVAGRLDDERTMRRLRGLVGRLPARDLEVLELCVWAELSYEEAAEILCVAVGTVRSRLSRARSRLRELTDGRGHESSERALATAVPTGEDMDSEEEGR